MRSPVAREGHPFIAAAGLPAMTLLIVALLLDSTLAWILALSAVALSVAVAAFFRDPNRQGPRGRELVVAPADGKVIDVGLTDEPTYIGGRALRISIFLSLFDVHVNRYPVSGEVKHRSYHPGRFEPAWRQSACNSNERASTGIDGESFPVLVRQVAGLVARRIVTYASLGDRVQQGDRMGLIRFGSRVDVYLPPTAVADVQVGQRALGGLTVLAHLREDG
ncbi:MAG: phosphatidylserine decarboxylase family protein [Gemmatimonadota bacterium]|nr:MAG: phosphatidylserine decarboxylase family protein [Gemmatimonadota bacterium]